MTKQKPKLKIINEDGNAFSILGKARKSLRRADVPESEIDKYLKEAMSGDYDNLLRVTCEWFEVY